MPFLGSLADRPHPLAPADVRKNTRVTCRALLPLRQIGMDAQRVAAKIVPRRRRLHPPGGCTGSGDASLSDSGSGSPV